MMEGAEENSQRDALMVCGFAVLINAAVTWYLFREIEAISPDVPLYVLDDAYIHLSMARSLAEQGVWGPTVEGFAPVSSSPLLTLLLGMLMAAFGAAESLLRCVEGAASVGFLWVGARLLCRHMRWWWAALALPLVSLLAPLPLLLALGMEHGLHTLLMLALVLGAGRLLGGQGSVAAVALFSGLAAGVRYESCALIALVAVLLWAQRRWRDGALVLSSGAVVPLTMGAVSLWNGWFFAPTGLVTKAALMWPQAGPFERWWLNIQANLSGAPALGWGSLALGLSFFAAPVHRHSTGEPRVLHWQAALILGLAMAHMTFGAIGWYHRYEAYLYALQGVVLSAVLARLLSSARAGNARRHLGVVLCLACTVGAITTATPRARAALSGVAGLARDLYTQNEWTARFLAAEFPGQRIVTHELGLVSWHTRRLPLDLAGLSSREIAALYVGRDRDLGAISELAEEGGYTMAWTFPSWFEAAGFGHAPANWIAVATLRTEGHSRQLGSDRFTFWALREDAATGLRVALERRQDQLPDGVVLEWSP